MKHVFVVAVASILAAGSPAPAQQGHAGHAASGHGAPMRGPSDAGYKAAWTGCTRTWARR